MRHLSSPPKTLNMCLVPTRPSQPPSASICLNVSIASISSGAALRRSTERIAEGCSGSGSGSSSSSETGSGSGQPSAEEVSRVTAAAGEFIAGEISLGGDYLRDWNYDGSNTTASLKGDAWIPQHWMSYPFGETHGILTRACFRDCVSKRLPMIVQERGWYRQPWP